jgi:opacity protein-like surface antigen
MKTLFVMALLVSVLGSTTVSADTFDGYECTDDCSGHQAGYDWAEDNGIDDEDSCDTSSQSFNEGCQSFVQGGSGIVSSDDDG